MAPTLTPDTFPWINSAGVLQFMPAISRDAPDCFSCAPAAKMEVSAERKITDSLFFILEWLVNLLEANIRFTPHFYSILKSELITKKSTCVDFIGIQVCTIEKI